MERLRVLGANNYHFVRGGSERYFLELGRLLAARGHRVAHLSTAHPSNEPAPGAVELVEPIDLERPGVLDVVRFHYARRAARAIERLIAAERPDVAHLHIYYGQLTPAILAPLARAGIPVVQTLHEYKPLCAVHSLLSRGAPCEACGGKSFWHALPRRCNRGSLPRTALSVSEAYVARALGADRHVRRYVAPSAFVRAKMLEHGFAPERVVHVPHWIDARALEPARGPGEHALFAGRLDAAKGVFVLLAAAEAVPELPLVVAGDGPARAAVERVVAERRLAHVRVLGRQDAGALAALVRASRAVVVPSLAFETFGLAALEALAQGRPVVASSRGALPELVEDGVNGFLVPPGDVEALAAVLRRVARDAGEAEELGRVARARALLHHGPDEHHAALTALYREVR